MRLPSFGFNKPPGPIVLPVPQVVDVDFLVFFQADAEKMAEAADFRPVVEAWLTEHCADPLRSVLLRVLNQRFVEVQVGVRGEMPEPPARMVDAWGPGQDEATRHAVATHTVWIRARDLLRPPRTGLWLALGTARALAESLDGVVLDTVFPRLEVLELLQKPLPGNGEIRVGTFVMIPQSVGKSGLTWTTTKGLSRFGLPELEVRDTPPNLGPLIGYLMSGAAQHLIGRLLLQAHESKEPPSQFVIPPSIRVSLDDIRSARAIGDLQIAGNARGWIEVGLEYHPGAPNQDSLLRLTPLPGSREESGVWWSTELTELIGSGESTLRDPNWDIDAMEAAHQQAVRELPTIRARFMAGLRPGELLVVKHGFPAEKVNQEFMWLAVTAWVEDRLTCVLMNQPAVRLDLRLGQQFELPESQIYDWALHLPDGGSEGGYTEDLIP